MSALTEVVGKLCCDICPFLDCYEKGTCYECNCFIDDSIKVENHCDHKTIPDKCPLMTGLRVTISASKDGELLVGNGYD